MIRLSLSALRMDDTEKILARRGLQAGGPAALFFASELARLTDPYVPMRTGTLKRTITIAPGRLTYRQHYAYENYMHNAGMGLQGIKRGGKRGPQWAKRSWTDHGPQIVRGVAKLVGGRPG